MTKSRLIARALGGWVPLPDGLSWEGIKEIAQRLELVNHPLPKYNCQPAHNQQFELALQLYSDDPCQPSSPPISLGMFDMTFESLTHKGES